MSAEKSPVAPNSAFCWYSLLYWDLRLLLFKPCGSLLIKTLQALSSLIDSNVSQGQSRNSFSDLFYQFKDNELFIVCFYNYLIFLRPFIYNLFLSNLFIYMFLSALVTKIIHDVPLMIPLKFFPDFIVIMTFPYDWIFLPVEEEVLIFNMWQGIFCTLQENSKPSRTLNCLTVVCQIIIRRLPR